MCDSGLEHLEKIGGYLREAQGAADRNQWAEAVRSYSKLLELEEKCEAETECPDGGHKPNNNYEFTRYVVLTERAKMYLKMGNARKCIKDAEEALQMEKQYVDAWLALGSAQLHLNLRGHAEVTIKKGLKIAEREDLKQVLKDIQSDEETVAPVRGIDGSDKRVREMQNNAGISFNDVITAPTAPMMYHFLNAGDIARVRGLWNADYLKHRITANKNPLIHLPILGRQRLMPTPPLQGYLEVIDFLFEQGVRLDHRDKVGYTALMYAAGQSPQPDLLLHLLQKGADPNVQSVYGTVALMDACMGQNLREIEILLKHGADPHVKDNDGLSPYTFAQPLKKMVALFEKFVKKPISKKACMKCHSKTGVHRCGACRVVYYCTKECQTSHWSDHKKLCKLSKKSHKRLKIDNSTQDFHHSLISNYAEAALHNHMAQEPFHGQDGASSQPPPELTLNLFQEYQRAWNKNGNLILKLQIPLTVGSVVVHSGLILTYDETKRIFCHMNPTEMDGPEVVDLLKCDGICGAKAYFYAYVEKDKPDEIIIITNPVLPAQPW